MHRDARAKTNEKEQREQQHQLTRWFSTGVGRKCAPRTHWQHSRLSRGWRPRRLPTSLQCTEQPLLKGVSDPQGQQCPGWETVRSIGNSFAYAKTVKDKTWTPFCSFFKKSLSYSELWVTSGSFRSAWLPRSCSDQRLVLRWFLGSCLPLPQDCECTS